MAATDRPKVVGFTVDNANQGEYVKVTNITSGGTMKGAVDSNGELTLNSEKELGTEWSEGDVVVGQISGRLNESSKKTLTKGGATFNFTSTATTTIPNLSL